MLDALFEALFAPIFKMIEKVMEAILDFILSVLFHGVLDKSRKTIKKILYAILIGLCLIALWYQIGPKKSSDPLEKIQKLEILKETILKKADSSKH